MALGPFASHTLFGIAAFGLLAGSNLLALGMLATCFCLSALVALLAGAMLRCLLSFGLLAPGPLFAGAAFGLLAVSLLAPGIVAACFGLSVLVALLAGATLRCLLSLGLLAFGSLFAGAACGLLSSGLRAPGVLPVVVAACGLLAFLVAGACLVVFLFLLDTFAALVVAGGCRRRNTHDQDRAEREHAQSLSEEGEFHVDYLIGMPTYRLA